MLLILYMYCVIGNYYIMVLQCLTYGFIGILIIK